VDAMGRLVGRITIDDIIDVIRDEADKDYQLAAGISQDVEADDSILELTGEIAVACSSTFRRFYRTRIGII
jgi:Mg/Co/Ni transporter MgtE